MPAASETAPQGEAIIDADVIEEGVAAQPLPAAPMATTELAIRPTREALTPIDPDSVVEGMRAYQDLLPKLLVPSDFQDAGRGKQFVKKSGWRKIARAFNLSVQIVHSTVERDAEGAPTRAEVWVRAIAPNGQVQDGDGYCSVEEDRFSGPRGNKSKLENDLRATATTRAKNRAIADLVGMGEVSAEEADQHRSSSEPPFGAPASNPQRVTKAIAFLIDTSDDGPGEEALVEQALAIVEKVIADAGGYFPQIAERALLHAAAQAKANAEASIPAAAEPSGDFVDGDGPTEI